MRVRDFGFNLALVMENTLVGGGYVLGFRLYPPNNLNKVVEQQICTNYIP